MFEQVLRDHRLQVGGVTHTASSKYHDEIIILVFIHTKYGEPIVIMVFRCTIQKVLFLTTASRWTSGRSTPARWRRGPWRHFLARRPSFIRGARWWNMNRLY
jgi:hypothetical protein